MEQTEAKTGVTISAIITRADGTIEDLGIICNSEDKTIKINEEEQ